MHRLTMAILAAAFYLLSSPVRAAEIVSNYTIGSDYVWRGKTRTGHGPAVQGGLDWDTELIRPGMGLNAGTLITNVSHLAGAGSGAQQDLYLNLKINNDDFGGFAGLYYYSFPIGNDHLDTVEYSLGLFYQWVDFTLHYTPDYFKSSSSSVYLDLKANIDLPENLVLSLGLGRTFVQDALKVGQTNYWDYSLALGREYEDFALQMNFTDTDRKLALAAAKTAAHDQSLFFSVSKIFN